MSKSLENSLPISKSKPPSKRGGYSRLIDPKKRAHVEAYLASGQQAYCAAHRLKVSRFKGWKLRYQREQEGYFTPVITPPEIRVCANGVRIEVNKGDSKVVICDIAEISSVITIMNALLSCN